MCTAWPDPHCTQIFSTGPYQLSARRFLDRIWAPKSRRACSCIFARRTSRTSALLYHQELLSMFLVKNIPLPWQLAYGLHMKVCALPYCLLSWYYFKSVNYVGRLQVIGKKSYSSGNFFLNYIRLLPRKFFLDNIYIPGKWFIFWYGCILANIYCRQWPSIQHKSKFRLEMG